MSEHTPGPAAGPWEVMPWSDGFVWPLPEPEHKPHAVIWTAHAAYESVAWVIPSPHAEADAHLIAAAPVMLVALKAAELALEAAVRTGDPATLQSVRAAIAKAEGRYP